MEVLIKHLIFLEPVNIKMLLFGAGVHEKHVFYFWRNLIIEVSGRKKNISLAHINYHTLL